MTPQLARPACGASSPLTLHIVNAARVNPAQLEKMVCTFYEVYPAMAALLKTEAPKEVTYSFVDQRDKPPAWVQGGTTVYYSTIYLQRMQRDIDVAVHELTHIIQGQQHKVPPGWIIEGTADWVRNRLGRYNQDIGWALPTVVAANDRYTDGYGTAAQFFNWVDTNYRQGKEPVAVALQVGAMQGVVYRSSVWSELTGKSLAELWSAHSGQPYVPPASTGLAFYTEPGFEGPAILLEKGRYDMADLLNLEISNDSIRSVRVPPGYKLTAYQHEHFSGAALVLSADASILEARFDRAISSLIIE
ncbi:basic secretory protein-like protein [Paucibacter sp. APW11]|uniref:Basic secretory protein-like protein n=1 Tax=Roseateles aquae TaxID=3077235 RepID=A0ABU3P986_9BURK|nr:basic secretory protein-like protein [Paucibacter sp. APW11]MDT8998648.1 basic secretory protein-like protein [Paucibacter sp. APW11]